MYRKPILNRRTPIQRFTVLLAAVLLTVLSAACGGQMPRRNLLPLPPTPTRIGTSASSPPVMVQASATPQRAVPPPTLTATPVVIEIVAPPPSGKLYHGVFPGSHDGAEDDLTLEDLRSYEQAAGKPAAWVYFSHNWDPDRRFPLQTATWIRSAGSIPYIRLMLRTRYVRNEADPFFTLERINQGDLDKDLRAWARQAAKFGTPLMAEFGTEVNLRQFTWNGTWNGGGETTGFGDPSQPDGPEQFQAAYRRIIQISREEEATNVLWVFHANQRDVPGQEWNRLEQYYPGDDWIDWIGVSVYGAQSPLDTEWEEFRPMMDAAYARLVALSPTKPIVVLEFGVTNGNPLGNQADWAAAALANLMGGRWPRVIGFAWWNEAWDRDDDPAHPTTMRLQDNPALAAVFQQLVGQNAAALGETLQIPAALR